MNPGTPRTSDGSSKLAQQPVTKARQWWRVLRASHLGERFNGVPVGRRVEAISGHAAACAWGRLELRHVGERARVGVVNGGRKPRFYDVVAAFRARSGLTLHHDDGRLTVWEAGELICLAERVG